MSESVHSFHVAVELFESFLGLSDLDHGSSTSLEGSYEGLAFINSF